MPGDKSVKVGRDMTDSIVNVGDGNRVRANITSSSSPMPSPESINISYEISEIREILRRFDGEHTNKIMRALDDAEEEASKPKPNRNEIGTALHRALEYAKISAAVSSELAKLSPHLINAASWLGSNWHHLLSMTQSLKA